jgi:hypothetical protein
VEDAFNILKYLPIRFKQPTEQEYITFLWDSYESNYENEKYQFSFMAYHMLFMSFVYFNIWQIKTIRKDDFEKIIIGFDNITSVTNPFMFSQENESKVLNLLKYLCSSHGNVNGLIGNYKKLVKERNDIAHANGNIPFKNEDFLISKIENILTYSEEIQSYSKIIIEECFESFLIESSKEEEREYPDISEQINEVLIHEHYLSEKDIGFCLDYDISRLDSHTNYVEIEKIFETLKDNYSED